MNNEKLRILNIINRFSQLVLSNKNVVGLGLGNKIINGRMIDIPTLSIFVKKKLSKNLINPCNVISQYINGALTDVIEAGENVIYRNEVRPAYGGLVIGNKIGTSGTLGYAVTEKNKRENIYLLSSAHVLGIKLVGTPEEIIFQPPVHMGGNVVASILGRITKTIPITIGEITNPKKYNEVDAGIALVGPNNNQTKQKLLSVGFSDGTIITETTKNIKAWDLIYKLGQKTGYSSGRIISTNTIYKLNYSDISEPVMYKNQIIAEIYSDKGDSGALGITAGDNKAFGLLMSGSGNLVTFNNINRVLDLLNVELLK